MNEMVKRAKEIIFANEGTYGTVNANDNGAVSVGCVQWHGNRAKQLLRDIIKMFPNENDKCLTENLRSEIMGGASWDKRTVNADEKSALMRLLKTPQSKIIQDAQAENDIQVYITHIMSLGFKDEETIIFLADIENQGGAGASNRIGTTALKLYGKNVTLEEVLKTANEDAVFKKYTARRLRVYKILTSSVALTVDGVFGQATIKALQKFLGVASDGVYGVQTKRALQKLLGVTVDGVVGKQTITALQLRLNVPDNGVFDVTTIKALQEFLNKQI